MQGVMLGRSGGKKDKAMSLQALRQIRFGFFISAFHVSYFILVFRHEHGT
jgi:hypothetical protein